MLSNERGTLTLGAVVTQSKEPPSFIGLLGPVRLQLTVEGGTGAYAQATGRGEGHLTVLDPTGFYLLTGVANYTLTLTADPSAAQASPAAERAGIGFSGATEGAAGADPAAGDRAARLPGLLPRGPRAGHGLHQVITEGYAIRLGWGGRQYEYRTPSLDHPPYLRLVQFWGRNWLIPLAFDAAPAPRRDCNRPPVFCRRRDSLPRGEGISSPAGIDLMSGDELLWPGHRSPGGARLAFQSRSKVNSSRDRSPGSSGPRERRLVPYCDAMPTSARMTQSDCGAAALATIALHHGTRIGVAAPSLRNPG